MADPVLPDLKPIAEIRRRALARVQPNITKAVQSTERADVDNLSEVVRAVGEIAPDNQMGQSVSRRFLEGMLSRRFGTRITIPTAQEEELEAAQRQHDLLQVQTQNAKSAVAITQSQLIDMGLPPNLMQDDPAAFVDAARTRLGANLSLGTLVLSGAVDPRDLDPELRAQRRAEEQLTGDVKRGKAFEERAKQVAGLQSGESAAGQALNAAFGAAEDASGQDLLAGSFLDDTDLDQPRGALALVTLYNQQQRTLGATQGSSVLADVFLKKVGKDLKDQVEGLPTNEAGQLIVGEGDLGVEPDALFMLSAFILRTAQDKRVPAAQVFADLGVSDNEGNPVQGIDLASFGAVAASKAASSQESAALFVARDLGLASLLGEAVDIGEGQRLPFFNFLEQAQAAFTEQPVAAQP